MGAGTVITFYSYKGGTGRSMSLANVAWILASNGHRVLVMDWDLEAPGLHRYFHPFLPDDKLRSSPGVIDMMWEFAHAAMDPLASDDPDWHLPYARTSPYVVSIEHEFANSGTIDLIPAGRQDSTYSALVSTFDWDNFYDRLGGGGFLEALRADMRDRYDYVIVDSRTGLSDTAGICTVALPDVVVTCFSMSTQSIDGAAAVAGSISHQRPDGLRILPVPMRVENGEHDKLESSRDYARHAFDSFLWHVDDLDRYWGQVEVPYRSYYAYEEILATLGDRPQQENTILAATERLVDHLTQGEVTSLVAVESEQKRRELLSLFLRARASTSPEPHRERPDLKVFVTYPSRSAGPTATAKKLLNLLREQGFDAVLDPDLERWATTLKQAKLIILEQEESGRPETGFEWDSDDVIRIPSDDVDDETIDLLVGELSKPRPLRLGPVSVNEWPWGVQALTTIRALVNEDLALRSTDATPHETSPLKAGWEAGGLDGSTSTLPFIFAKTQSRKLIVLGEPGSGKTLTLLRLARDLLSYSKAHVPVPLTLETWRPTTEYFDDWVVRSIAENFPSLPPSSNLENDIVRLVRLGAVIPVIDGLDELPPEEYEQAILQIARIKTPVIATCGTEGLTWATRELRPGRASVVQLLPIELRDAVRYLTENTIRRDNYTWSVLDRLQSRRDIALVKVLADPAMVTLTRSYLDSPRADLEQLIALKSTREVRDVLVDSYAEEAFGRRLHRQGAPDYSSPHTQRWLTFIATLPGATFRWWELHKSVPVVLHRLYLWLLGIGLAMPPALGITVEVSDPELRSTILIAMFALITLGAISPQPPVPRLSMVGYLWPFVRPAGLSQDGKPVRTPQSARNSTLTFVTGATLSGALWGLIIGFATNSLTNTQGAFQTSYIFAGAWCGVVAGVAGAMVTTWPRYVVSKALLSAMRRLPAQLDSFLVDASQRGILRRVGSTYVFRDERLANVLAERRRR